MKRAPLDALPEYASDAELARALMGERAPQFKGVLPLLEAENFPKIDPLFGGRCVMAVKEYIRWRAGIRKDAPMAAPADDRVEDLASWQKTRPRRGSGASPAPTAPSNIIGFATQEAVRAGFPLKSTTLRGLAEAELPARCQALQGQMARTVPPTNQASRRLPLALSRRALSGRRRRSSSFSPPNPCCESEWAGGLSWLRSGCAGRLRAPSARRSWWLLRLRG